MEHVFWLEEGQLAGRSGPNKHPWDLQQLKQEGFAAIASLNDGAACDSQQLKTLDIAHQIFNLPDNIPPKPEDLAVCVELLPKVIAFIDEQRQQGKTVLLHCRSGINRTELVMAYYLMRNGAAPVHAVSQTRVASGLAFDADGWDQFVYDVLYALQ
ncbi:protein phosphatase [Shewanella maritima]|uniref:Protein phosphatase n=1 Tax=Shewanella maritima TaxID=2520507 RepID=A0A411PN31_9GAMM|nr:dual specificity protein phosphatase family protein [Shewanella maritima]QBF84943.1 protein phosphatase [Shewanella maritima]